jgi:hypothetical protein
MPQELTYEQLKNRVHALEQVEFERKKTEEEHTRIFSMSLDMICIADINTVPFVKVNPVKRPYNQ